MLGYIELGLDIFVPFTITKDSKFVFKICNDEACVMHLCHLYFPWPPSRTPRRQRAQTPPPSIHLSLDLTPRTSGMLNHHAAMYTPS